MPEMTDSEYRQFVQYQELGTPNEVKKKINDLERDNASQRDSLRQLKEQVPGDDQVIVSKQDADLLPKYRELGTPDEVKTKIEEGTEAQARAQALEQRQSARAFVEAAGLAQEAIDTLVAIPALEGAKFEVRKSKTKDEQGNETEVDVGYITLPGEDAMSFAKAQEKVPALKGLRTAEPQSDGEKTSVKYVKQSGDESGGGDQESVYDRIRKNRKQEREAQEKDNRPAAARDRVEDRLGMTTSQ